MSRSREPTNRRIQTGNADSPFSLVHPCPRLPGRGSRSRGRPWPLARAILDVSDRPCRSNPSSPRCPKRLVRGRPINKKRSPFPETASRATRTRTADPLGLHAVFGEAENCQVNKALALLTGPQTHRHNSDGKKSVGQRGLEPRTPSPPDSYANHLRYCPTDFSLLVVVTSLTTCAIARRALGRPKNLPRSLPEGQGRGRGSGSSKQRK